MQVEFWPEQGSPRSTGATDANGRYTLTTDGAGKPGAVIGRHKVVLYDLAVYEQIGIRPREDTNIRAKPARFSHLYNDPGKTPVTVTVGAQSNEIEITIEAE